MPNLVKELRCNNIELRTESLDSKLIVEGYAIVWNAQTLIGDEEYGYYEEVDRNALNGANMKDVPLKYNHMDNTYILARTRNNSLTLTIDDYGLKVRAELQSNVQAHVDAYNMIQSGLLDKMSFAFTVAEQDLLIDEINHKRYRKITKIDRLFDVSVVDVPAYDQTSISARSVDSLDKEFEALEKASAKTGESKRNYEIENLIKIYGGKY